MNPVDFLRLNGDFYRSPLVETVRRIHELMERAGGTYAVIGGMAVIRHGGLRTTHDVDILTTRETWDSARSVESSPLVGAKDHAEDATTGVPVDLLFAGDDWDMPFALPAPTGDVREFDPRFGAYYVSLPWLLSIKTGAYVATRDADGPELAAKDLADLVLLIQKNGERLTPELLGRLHPTVRREFEAILTAVRRRRE
jgi:hypothetical protein